MDGTPFEDSGFDYSGQPLPSLSSTLLQGKGQDSMHSIQVMLGLQQPHDVFSSMGAPLEYKTQKLDGSPMHHQDFFPQALESSAKRNKTDDVILLQSQGLASGEVSTPPPAPKKSDKKKGDNNGVKKKKTR